MDSSLAKLELENTTRLLYFKHRGNLAAIIEELRAKYEDVVDNSGERITVVYVRKVIAKFKRQQRKNDPYVATNIMDYVFMGTKQREQLWDADEQKLEEQKYYYLSGCCDKMTRRRVDAAGETVFTCLNCDKICQGYRQVDLRIFELQRKLRVERRNDEEHLVKSTDTLGFGGEKAPIMKNYFNQLVTTDPRTKRINSKVIKNLPAGDQHLIENTEEMDARDREAIIKEFETLKRKAEGDGWPERD